MKAVKMWKIRFEGIEPVCCCDQINSLLKNYAHL